MLGSIYGYIPMSRKNVHGHRPSHGGRHTGVGEALGGLWGQYSRSGRRRTFGAPCFMHDCPLWNLLSYAWDGECGDEDPAHSCVSADRALSK